MRMRVKMQHKLAGGDKIKGREQVQRREARMRRATRNSLRNVEGSKIGKGDERVRPENKAKQLSGSVAFGLWA